MKRNWLDRNKKWVLIGSWILAAWVAAVSVSNAATVYYPIPDGGGADSIRIVIYDDGARFDSLWLGSDTSMYGNFDGRRIDSIALDDQSVWTIHYWYYFTGDTIGYPAAEILSFIDPGDAAHLYTLRVYAIDTSGTDDTVSNVWVTLQNTSGTPVGVSQQTNSGGYTEWSVNAATFNIILGDKGGYLWNDTLGHVLTANDTVDASGYNAVPSPFAAATATVSY